MCDGTHGERESVNICACRCVQVHSSRKRHRPQKSHRYPACALTNPPCLARRASLKWICCAGGLGGIIQTEDEWAGVNENEWDAWVGLLGRLKLVRAPSLAPGVLCVLSMQENPVTIPRCASFLRASGGAGHI